jgi:heme-degrading monooxygenase HmoA
MGANVHLPAVRRARYQAAMFLVVFRNRKRADIDSAAYALDADAMEALSREQPGFISFKSYVSDDGEVIALSEWIDEAAALAWRRVASHAQVQGKGRTEYYESYTLFAGTPSRVHHFKWDEA